MHATQQGTAPAIVRPGALRDSIRVEPLSCALGAEVSNVSLADAAVDDALLAEIRALWLAHKVLFFRDQDMTPAAHVAFARRFGELQDHPVAGSNPEHPGLRRGATSLRSAACCDASRARRWAATPCGPTWRSPTRSSRRT
jgi:taurine dioxygenase